MPLWRLSRFFSVETPRQQAGEQPADEPLGVAVIGAGAISQTVHLPVLSALATVRLLAVCDIDAVRAATVARR
ncbi:MAG: hypothetical protein C4289_13190, partial [Chloroflexota bacterium]